MSLAESHEFDAVAASPDDADALEARARLRAQSKGGASDAVADYVAALRLRLRAGEFAARELGERGRASRPNNIWDVAQSELRWQRARAIAFFTLALEEAPDDNATRLLRARLWGEIGDRARAKADLEAAGAAAAHSLPTGALAEAGIFFDSWELIAATYTARVELKTELAQGLFGPDILANARTARRKRAPYHVQLAWLDLAVEAAPDNIETRLMRGKLLAMRSEREAALADFGHAERLRPEIAEIYRARGNALLGAAWWSSGEAHDEASANYARAIRLDIAAGKLAANASAIAARAAQSPPRGTNSYGYVFGHALYTVALEYAPDDAALYVARARVLEWPIIARVTRPEAQRGAACRDNVRALGLDATLAAPRASIVRYLSARARRASSHQQIEALLEARELLTGFGLSAELTAQIMAEVQVALQ